MAATGRGTGHRAAGAGPAAALLALLAAWPAFAAPVGTLSVLTYNVAGLPEGLSGSHPAANHPQVSPLLNAYDLVLVQEDFFYHDLLVADLEHPHQSVKDDSLSAIGTGFGDGLNTFSRLPFTDFTRVTWTTCNGLFDSGSDCLTPKGFSFQRHEFAPGVLLDVYNWHSDAGSSDLDLAARRDNVRQLYEYVATHSAGNAVIVLGDTNSRYTRAGDILPEMLAAVGLLDVWVELERDGALPPVGSNVNAGCASDPGGGLCERVDKILYRSSPLLQLEALAHDVPVALFSDGAGIALSDHDPVHALFGWRVVPEPGSAALLAAGLLGLGRRRSSRCSSPRRRPPVPRDRRDRVLATAVVWGAVEANGAPPAATADMAATFARGRLRLRLAAAPRRR